MFFSKRVVLVEGDTEKFIIPFWASQLALTDKKYDLSASNISVVECGGKTNLHVFMRVLNKFSIPYVVIHDADPIDFPEDKPEKTDEEKQRLRMFRENAFIEGAIQEGVGKVIKIDPELETIIDVSKSQAKREGKVAASFFKYEEMDTNDYPQDVLTIIDSIIEWTHPESSIVIQNN